MFLPPRERERDRKQRGEGKTGLTPMKQSHDGVAVTETPDSSQVRSLSGGVRHGSVTPSSFSIKG